MHVPDGFLDTRTAVAAATFSAIGLTVAVRRAQKEMPRRRIPLMGLAGAFIFVAQMLNFPVAAGTSGHLVGAVLAAVFLGPGGAVIVLSAVLVVQCLVFADGGILALGANIFNMGLVAGAGGWSLYAGIQRVIPGERGRFVAIAFASWLGTVAGAICCAGELAWSGTVPWSAAFPAMANVHMIIGIGEAVITTLVAAAVWKARPELFHDRHAEVEQRGNGMLLLGGLIVCGLLLFVSPFASTWPDGLERVSASLGFGQRAITQSGASSLFADYRIPGIESAVTSTVIAGAIGAVVVFLLSFLLASIVTAKQMPVASGKR